MKKSDKYNDIRVRIRLLFKENKQRYGYRRIYGLLKREKRTVSEKVVRQIMREEGLIVICKRRRKYNSYQWEISPSVPNRIERNFQADKPKVADKYYGVRSSGRKSLSFCTSGLF